MFYWKHSGFYLFFFASVGAFMPYWSVYLQEIGFPPEQISALIAIILGTKVIAPNVWGWLADRSGRRVRIIRVGMLFALVLFSGVTVAADFWQMALVLAAFGFFWNAVLPQFEAVTLTRLGDEFHRYSSIRLWGSVGFIASVSGLGSVFQRFGIEILPWIVLVLLAAILFSSLAVRENSTPKQFSADGQQPIQVASLVEVLKKPPVWALLMACFFMQASHGPYYSFFTIFLEDNGYSRTVVGQLWALGVIAEVGVFLVMHRLLLRFGAWKLLLASLFLTAVRWLVIALFIENLPVLLSAQLLHAASFGIYHAAAIQLIHLHFRGAFRGRGQALYSSLSFGLGGALGSLASGQVWARLGGTETYLMGAVLAGLGFVVAYYGTRRNSLSASRS